MLYLGGNAPHLSHSRPRNRCLRAAVREGRPRADPQIRKVSSILADQCDLIAAIQTLRRRRSRSLILSLRARSFNVRLQGGWHRTKFSSVLGPPRELGIKCSTLQALDEFGLALKSRCFPHNQHKSPSRARRRSTFLRLSGAGIGPSYAD